MPEGYDGTARPWYKQAAQAGAPVLTPAYVDASLALMATQIPPPMATSNSPT